MGAESKMDRPPAPVKPRLSGGRWWFLALLPAFVALLLAPERIGRFFLGFAYRGPLVDEDAWRDWAAENAGFFAPLRTGAEVAVVEDAADSTGVVFRRTDEGLRVEKSHLLAFSQPHVVLAMPPEKAYELQQLSMPEQGDVFWDVVKLLTREGLVRVFRLAPPQELDELGLTTFLRSFDIYEPGGA